MKKGEEFCPKNKFRICVVPDPIIRYKNLSWGAKILYGVLAKHAGDDTSCFPKQKTLAKYMNTSLRSIQYYIYELEKNEFIRKELPTGQDRLKHKSVKYYFIWHEWYDNYDSADTQNTATARHAESNECEVNESYINEVLSNDNTLCSTNTEPNNAPPHSPSLRKKQAEIICPDTIKLFIDYWEQHGLRKHRITSKTYGVAVSSLKKLVLGKFFNDKPSSYKEFYNRQFDLDDWRTAVDRFSLMVNSPDFYPKNKDNVKNIGLNEFLYNVYSKIEKSYFLKCLHTYPKRLDNINDTNPKLTDILIQKYKETFLNGVSITFSEEDRIKFTLGANQLIRFIDENRSKISPHFMNTNQDKARLLLKAIEEDKNGFDVSPGWVCSSRTFSHRLPSYLKKQGITEKTQNRRTRVGAKL